MEKELKAARQFNKAAVVVIILLLLMMSFMLVNTSHLADRYAYLEENYEQLHEEIKGSTNE